MTTTVLPVTDTPPESPEELRGRLRAFLDDHSPGQPPRDPAGRVGWEKQWNAILYDHGFAGPSWPREHGGMALPFTHHLAYAEEIARARVPRAPGTGVGIAGPTIIRHGTPDQQERWLRPMLRADVTWAQAFSEPEAGSDLAALRTRAVRAADGYRVTGQKLWSTQAQHADLFFALVRTGPAGSRERGISYLVIDAHQPGVTVRPLRDLLGGTRFCEVFFDDAWAAAADRVGAEDEGWAIARTSLGHERAAGAATQAGFYRRVMDELLALARERGVSALDRGRLLQLEVRVRVMALNALRTVDAITTTGDPGPMSSIARLSNTVLEQELHEVAVALLGPYGTLDRDDPQAVQRGRWTRGLLSSRAATIGAGTAEVQRNTIAERVLGLPRDPTPRH